MMTDTGICTGVEAPAGRDGDRSRQPLWPISVDAEVHARAVQLDLQLARPRSPACPSAIQLALVLAFQARFRHPRW